MNKKRKRKIISFLHTIVYVFLLFLFARMKLIELKQINLLLLLLKIIIVIQINSYIHEGIHYIAGKMAMKDAEFKITVTWTKAYIKRAGGNPTVLQEQIHTIAPCIVIGGCSLFLGFLLQGITDVPFWFFVINTAGSVGDIVLFLELFCFPMRESLSECNDFMKYRQNLYCRFWNKMNYYCNYYKVDAK